jgi:hypothetical protein
MQKLLRQFIKEEVERNMRWMAGFFGGGNIGKSRKGNIVPPPGLGLETEDNEETEEQNNGKEKQANQVPEEQRRCRIPGHDRRSLARRHV